jgi:hypothetical protein
MQAWRQLHVVKVNYHIIFHGSLHVCYRRSQNREAECRLRFTNYISGLAIAAAPGGPDKEDETMK